MAPNRNIKNLVSNPVFLAPQSSPQEGAETNSQILYANKFSGLPEVAMSKDLEEVFANTPLNLTDTNFRLQLQHLLEEYDSENGPWYIDGTNGVIHIHNRKIAESAFVYRYQDENGEVLKVQITTNWTTGSSSGTVASLINKDKERNIIRLDSPTHDFTEPEHHKQLFYWLSQDNTRLPGQGVGNWVSTYYDDEGRMVDKSIVNDAWVASQNINVTRRREDTQYIGPITEQDIAYEKERKRREIVKRNNEVYTTPGLSYNNSHSVLDQYVSVEDEAIDEWQDKILEKVMSYGGGGNQKLGEQYKAVFNKLKNGEEVLSAVEQEMASKSIWLEGIVPDKAVTARTFKIKNQKRRGGSGNMPLTVKVSDTHVSRSTGAPGTVISALNIYDLEKQLEKNRVGIQTESYGALGHHSTFQPAPEIMETARLQIQKAFEEGGGIDESTIHNIQVRINEDGSYDVDVTAVGKYPGVVTLTEFASWAAKREEPGVGGSKKARALAQVNRMRNRAKKAKHKEIEVQMVVIGRPSLEAGQYMDILNIGRKYSGQWYIKTCIHQLDSNGYTCSLTLKRNQNTSGGSAITSTRKKDGTTSGFKYEVHTQDGIVELTLTPSDAAHAERLSQADAQASFNKFINTAIIAQKQGTYGDGLMRPTNLKDIHLDGTIENPDVIFQQTAAGKAAEKAYEADKERRIKMAQAARAKLQAKKRGK